MNRNCQKRNQLNTLTYAIITLLILVSNVVFAEEENVISAENLLKYTFQDTNKDGIPDGYKIVKGKAEGNEAAEVTYDETVFNGEKGPSIKMYLPEKGYLAVDLKNLFRLKKGKQYLFAVDVKIKDMKVEGKWYTKKAIRALMIYVYGSNGKHAWLAITGNGSTKGWVTVMLPFNTEKIPGLATSRVLIRCNNMSGTVWIQNPSIVELPDGTDMKSHFLLSDGSVYSTNPLRLKSQLAQK